MLKLRPTYEEILRETRTRRLRILPERERRTTSGMLLDEVDFDDFDLGKYDKKIMITNENPQKGTQTDLFSDHSSYSSTSESLKTAIEPDKEEQQVESEHSIQTSKLSSKSSEKSEQEPEQQKSLMRRLFDSLFEEVEVEMPISRQTSSDVSVETSRGIRDSGARGSNEPMPTKKDETPLPSSSSSSISHHPSDPYDNLPIASSNASSRSSRMSREASAETSTIHYGSSRPASTIHYGSERSNRPISVRSSPISVRSSHISVKSSPIVISSASSSRS